MTVDCSKREREHHRPCFNPFFLFPFGFKIPLLCQVIPHFVPCCTSRMYFGGVACLWGAECDGSLAADARLWRLTILNSGFSSSTASGDRAANAALKANKHLFHIKVNITRLQQRYSRLPCGVVVSQEPWKKLQQRFSLPLSL